MDVKFVKVSNRLKTCAAKVLSLPNLGHRTPGNYRLGESWLLCPNLGSEQIWDQAALARESLDKSGSTELIFSRILSWVLRRKLPEAFVASSAGGFPLFLTVQFLLSPSL